MYRVALSYCGSVIVAFILGSILATQFVLDKLTDLGIGVLLVDRLKVTFKDILGLSGTYLPLIAIALALAFATAHYLARFGGLSRTSWFVFAGFVALIALHIIMKEVLGLTGIAATRTLAGLLSQGLAGALAGASYAYFSQPKR